MCQSIDLTWSWIGKRGVLNKITARFYRRCLRLLTVLDLDKIENDEACHVFPR